MVGQPAEVSMRMEKKGDLRDFEPRIIVGLRQAALSTSKLFDLLEFSRALNHYEDLLRMV